MMVSVKLTVALSFSVSVAVRANGNVPETVGVPAIPVTEPLVCVSASPDGRGTNAGAQV